MTSSKQIKKCPTLPVSAIVDKIVHLDNRNISKYLKNYNVTSLEIYNWLLNNQDNLNCIVLLGEFNQLGIETCINNEEAFELYKTAANLGYSLGIYQLANCYYNGIGTSIDLQKAFRLYQRAANLGFSRSQFNLAIMYENGDGVMRNIDQAIYWFEKYADQRDFLYAQNELLNIKEFMLFTL